MAVDATHFRFSWSTRYVGSHKLIRIPYTTQPICTLSNVILSTTPARRPARALMTIPPTLAGQGRERGGPVLGSGRDDSSSSEIRMPEKLTLKTLPAISAPMQIADSSETTVVLVTLMCWQGAPELVRAAAVLPLLMDMPSSNEYISLSLRLTYLPDDTTRVIEQRAPFTQEQTRHCEAWH